MRGSAIGVRPWGAPPVGVSYAVLGPLEATVDGRPARLGGPRARAVLAMLLLRAGQVVPARVLVDAVWGERPPVSSGNLLQGYICLLYTSPSPRDGLLSRMPSSA